MYIKNEKGAILPLVLIVMLVLVFLGTILLFLSVTESRQVAKEEKNMQAYYIARSGADAIAKYIIENKDEATKLIDAPPSNPVYLVNGEFKSDYIENPEDDIGGSFVVNITRKDKKIVIISTATVKDFNKTVSLTLNKTTNGYTRGLWK
ncbi:hypothetical protein [Crassaminicella profunda]|uniref:hypothetical protein n=1 Tax=Crassaminicella profunda TaxID=1286698 RepID=UPI001CA695C9|nr:hypothetical protein [Crassaminicella profunda]QZY56984.1 hypothetical protein K7H06_08715 [Crassaminicella profunda]